MTRNNDQETDNVKQNEENARWKKTAISDGFWGTVQRRFHDVTLPIEYEQCVRTGRISALKCHWKPGEPQKPHFFWDSDIAKWIEAASYGLSLRRDEKLVEEVDKIVDMIEAMQRDDGYFNIYYTVVEPGKRFTYLKRMHELYCLGHMIEAAVAYHQATGKSKLLDIVCRYANLLCKILGREDGQIPGYDGHPEIELALVKLYKETGEEKYLNLAEFLVEERGREPSFFEAECEQRGEAPEDRQYRFDMQGMYAYYQAHKPVYEQRRAVGHAVRAMYLYCGMADVAACTANGRLLEACSAIWENITQRQMYITGGIGPNPKGERFTYDYDLPNAMSYNETCASIGLFMFAHRMLTASPKGEYGDIMERCLYNTILGGVSLGGNLFYYSNPLSANPEAYKNMNEDRSHITLGRQKWFEVACCPPNLARLVLSLSGYVYVHTASAVFVNLYINSKTKTTVGNIGVTVSQRGSYPWKPDVELEISPEKPVRFALNLRIPSWSDTFNVELNGEHMNNESMPVKDGFLSIERTWEQGDKIKLTLDLRARRTEARPEVTCDCGRVALERGPMVYCFEETDNGKNLYDIRLSDGEITEAFEPDLLGGVVTLSAFGYRRDTSEWPAAQLYRSAGTSLVKTALKAVPFYSRLNRAEGEMIVWIRT